MVASGFLDDVDGVLVIHDLQDHEPDYVRRRRTREAERRSRSNTGNPHDSADQSLTGHRPDDDQALTPTTAPAPAHSKNTGHSAASKGGDRSRSPARRQMPKRSDQKAVRRTADAEGFSSFWELWPDRKARQEAEAAFVFDLEDEERKSLTDRTADYLDRRRRAEAAGVWVPHLPNPATFIRKRRWEDAFANPKDSNPVAEEFQRQGIALDSPESP
jgi:hypothetical protein